MNLNHYKNLERLQRLSENELRKLIIPLLYEMGYKGIFENHGSSEKGKDIIFSESRLDGSRFYIGIALKANDIDGTGGNTGLTYLINQIRQSFYESFIDKESGEKRKLHECWVMTSGKILPTAFENNKDQLSDIRIPIRYFEGKDIVHLINNNLKEFKWEEFDEKPKVERYLNVSIYPSYISPGDIIIADAVYRGNIKNGYFSIITKSNMDDFFEPIIIYDPNTYESGKGRLNGDIHQSSKWAMKIPEGIKEGEYTIRTSVMGEIDGTLNEIIGKDKKVFIYNDDKLKTIRSKIPEDKQIQFESFWNPNKITNNEKSHVNFKFVNTSKSKVLLTKYKFISFHQDGTTIEGKWHNLGIELDINKEIIRPWGIVNPRSYYGYNKNGTWSSRIFIEYEINDETYQVEHTSTLEINDS